MSLCRDLSTLVELVETGKNAQEQQAAIKAIARTAAMSPLNEAVLVDAGAIKVVSVLASYEFSLASHFSGTKHNLGSANMGLCARFPHSLAFGRWDAP